jgi:Fe-Mn family superoxide dismutase
MVLIVTLEAQMSETLSRREVVLRSMPALAMAGVVAGLASPLLADPPAGAAPAADADLAFKDGQYVLPPLAYGYDALEPHIDADTMHLHHDKHHLGYVNGLNKALAEMSKLDAADTPPTPPLLSGLEEDLTFNAGGHLLHTLFWKIMGPNAGGEPSGGIADALNKDFGSVANFRRRFAAVAAGVKGSGWAILAYEPIGDRLIAYQTKQHDLQVVPWSQPILVLDVWEHAYYLKYKNMRTDYVKAWWNVVNWGAVDQALDATRKRFGH